MTENSNWKSAAGNPEDGNYVEVRFDESGRVWVRESDDPGLDGILVFDPDEWDAFIKGVKNGEFDNV